MKNHVLNQYTKLLNRSFVFEEEIWFIGEVNIDLILWIVSAMTYFKTFFGGLLIILFYFILFHHSKIS